MRCWLFSVKDVRSLTRLRFWRDSAAALQKKNIAATGEMLREKMKGMKRTYSKLKASGAGNDYKWEYWSRMSFIIDGIITDKAGM